MTGLDKDRFRNKTISFRMSPDERRILNARIKASGMSKSQFFIEMLLKGSISIRVGKYESDRLSLELRELNQLIKGFVEDDNLLEINETLKDIFVLLDILIKHI